MHSLEGPPERRSPLVEKFSNGLQALPRRIEALAANLRMVALNFDPLTARTPPRRSGDQLKPDGTPSTDITYFRGSLAALHPDWTREQIDEGVGILCKRYNAMTHEQRQDRIAAQIELLQKHERGEIDDSAFEELVTSLCDVELPSLKRKK